MSVAETVQAVLLGLAIALPTVAVLGLNSRIRARRRALEEFKPVVRSRRQHQQHRPSSSSARQSKAKIIGPK